MNLFKYENYKTYVKARIRHLDKQGHGQFKRIADHLSIGSVNVSQIFNGDRNFTIEQACEVSEFFGFNKLESKYFVSLVELERAGSFKLKNLIRERLDELRNQSQDLKTKLIPTAELSEESKAIFYSQWFYSGIRLLTSIKEYQSPETIAQYFGLPLAKVGPVIEFLLQTGLCKTNGNNIQMGPSSTHIESTHPLVTRHHSNWRQKAIQNLDHLKKEELCLTLPCSLNAEAFNDIRNELIQTIERITNTIDAAPSDQLACLNIDWFRF